MKKIIKRLGTALLAGLLCLTSLSLMPLKVQAATITHGNVQITDTDFSAICNRLKAKYPSIFLTSKVYQDGVEVGTEDAVRVLITNSTTHLQSGNQGATEKYINGSTASTSNSAFGLPSFLNNEVFTVNGHIGYCFDWLTPSRTGQHVASSSLAEAGINVRSGVDVIGLAEAAKMLTQNNFALITNNANQLAMSLTVPASNYNSSMTIPKSAVVALLQDTSADATAFKRGLVQMLVWGKMNDLPYSDYMYYFISDSAGYWDKEGNWHTGGSGMRTAPIIGIAGFIDLDKMYQLGYQAYQNLKTSVTQSADWERQYELTVGEPFTVPAADVENIGKILDANGGKIDPNGTVQVSRSSNGQTITLTATQELTDWTTWQGVTEDSSMIYSSKPYNSSYTGSNGRVLGSGQFIVDVNAIQYFRARVKAAVPVTGTVSVAKVSDDGMVEGLSFKLEGPVTMTKQTDASGRITFSDLPLGTYTVTEVLTTEQKKVYTTEGPWTFTLDASHPSYTVSAHNGLITKNVKVKKTAEDDAKAGFTFQLIGSTVNGMQITRAGTTDANGEIDFGQIPKGTYTIQEINVPDQYISPDPQTITVADSDMTVTFSNKLKVGTIEIIKKTDDGVLEGFNFHLSGKTIGGKTYEDDATTNAAGKATFTNVPYGDYTVSEVDVPVRYIVPEDQNITLSTAGPATLTFVNETSGKVTVKKVSSDGIISGISFSLKGTSTFTGEEIIRSSVTNNDGVAVFEDLPAGQYRIEESGVKEWYTVSPAYREVTLAAGDSKEVSFTNTLKTGSVKIIKTSEDGTLQDFTFKLEGYALNEKFYSFEATTDENGVATFDRVPIGGPYQVTEVLNESQAGLYKAIEIRDIFVQESETAEIPVFNELNRYAVRIIKTSESGLLKGFTFELSGTDIAGREVLLTAETNADGIAEFADIAPGTYRVREVNTPDYFVVPEGQTVTITNADAELHFHNEYQSIDVLIKKVNEDGVVEGFTFVLSGKAVSGENIYREVTTNAEGKATFERVPWGSYTISESYTEFQEQVYLPTANRTLKVEAGSTDKTITWTNRLRKFEVSVVKTSENDDIEGKSFRLFGTSLTGVEIDITKKTDKDGYISFGQIPLGEYTISENETPFWFVQPEDQEVVVESGDVVKEFYNTLARGTIIVNKNAEDGILEGFVFHLTGVSYGGIEVDEVAITDENGVARFENIPYGEFTVTEELSEAQAYVYVQNEAFTVDLRTDEEACEVNNCLIRQKVQVVKTSENDEIEGITFHLFGKTVNGMEVDEYATTDADGVAEFAAEKGGIPRGEYTVEEVDTKYYFIDPDAQSITVATEDLELSFWNELQKADLEVTKSSEDEILAGFTFHLYGTAASGVKVDVYAETDENGKIVFEQIPWGIFTLEEVLNENQAFVYKLNAFQSIDLVYKETESTEFHNELIRQKVQVIKTSENGEIEGVTFHLFGKTVNGMEVDEYATTNAEGIAEFAAEKGGIPRGSYTIEEVDVPEYIQDPGNKKISLSEDVTLSFENLYKRGSITLSKKDSDTDELLSSSVFGVFEWNGEDYAYLRDMIDNGDGTYSSSELLWTKENEGRYTVRETVAPEGYFLIRNDGENKFVVSFREDGLEHSFEASNMKPEISTEVQIPLIPATDKVKITDTVRYRNLLIGKTYTVQGILMDKETGEPLLIDGKEVVAETTFIAEVANGSIDVIFELDASEMAGKTLVVFESLLMDSEDGTGSFPEVEGSSVLIAVHRDMEDEAQTIYIPKIWTEASDTNTSGKTLYGTTAANVKDIVSYENLIPDQTYTVKGELMDKETGKGTGIYAEASFTTDEANGSVTLLFSFDGSGYIGKELVAFERIYDADGNLIGIHEDLEDEVQTVKVIQPEPAPKTGDESQLIFWGVITALSLAAVIVISRKVIKEEETV